MQPRGFRGGLLEEGILELRFEEKVCIGGRGTDHSQKEDLYAVIFTGMILGYSSLEILNKNRSFLLSNY